MGVYRILKKLEGVLVNDSEGIPMEWDTYEDAKKIVDSFQMGGLRCVIILPNGKEDTPINMQSKRQI